MKGMSLEELKQDTLNLNRKELVEYLKKYRSRELVGIATDMGLYCHANASKTVALQKVLEGLITCREVE